MQVRARRGARLRASVPVALGAGLLLLSACSSVGTEILLGPPPPTDTPRSPAVAGQETPSRDDAPLPAAPEGPTFDPLLTSSVAGDPQVRERVEFWVRLWGGQQTDLFGRYLDRMATHVLLVDEELERRGLPPSLRYLPVVESGYLPSAVSRVGATGLWQIMGPTGRDLGLSVTGVVDDRRDPVAATYAALDYLEQLHTQFDSWVLALAAYNAGPGRISGILSQYGTGLVASEDERFLAIRSRLPAETRDFIPRFFAAATLAGDPEAYGFPPVAPRPLLYDEVIVPDATSLDVVARAAGVPEEQVLALNPQFLRGFTPAGEERAVRVPQGRSFQFERNYALLPPHERLSFLEHVVASGETFSHIAAQYGVSLAELTGLNSQVDPRRLRIGMRILIPLGDASRTAGSGAPSAVVALASRDSENARGGVHIVSSGESLWTIARQYGVTIRELAITNGRTEGDPLRVGQELRIP